MKDIPAGASASRVSTVQVLLALRAPAGKLFRCRVAQQSTAPYRTALHSTARLNGIVGLAWLGWVLVDDGGTQSMTGRLLTAIHAA